MSSAAENYDWSPCKIVDFGDSYSLLFSKFEKSDEFLVGKGFHGGGYTWHGIVDALIRLHAPETASKLAYDPEGSMFVVRSADLEAMKMVQQWIRKADGNQEVLQQAIDAANPDIIE